MLATPPVLRNPSTEEIQRHLGLVKQVVARFLRRLPANVVRDDLLAAGVYGLVDSLRKNGGDHGPTFESYARIRIRGAILDELRTQDWLPRRARWAVSGKTEATDDGPVSVVGLDDLSAQALAAHLVDEAQENAVDALARCEENELLARAIEQLPARERTIVQMHYFQGARFKDIGALLGVSEPRISQLHGRAMGQLKKLLAQQQS